MRCVLAIDAGGSKCDALLVRDDGVALGWGRCDIADPEAGRGWSGSGRSVETVTRAVKRAMGEHSCRELHITTFANRRWAEETLAGAERIVQHSVAEYDGPFALAGTRFGVVALAGTGAFVFGRTRDGRACHLDGLGPNLGDYGSGYQIGMMALRAAARSGWHPRHHTSLADPVYRACVNHPGDERGHGLVGYTIEHHDRAEIASLAKIVDIEANGGDRVARQILRAAATSLAETLYDVVDRLGLKEEEYPLIGTGSIATRSRIYWRHFCRLAKEFAPHLKPFVPDLLPVVGVALCTLQEVTPDNMEDVRSTLLQTAREWIRL